MINPVFAVREGGGIKRFVSVTTLMFMTLADL
jgi:hypothetical protein